MQTSVLKGPYVWTLYVWTLYVWTRSRSDFASISEQQEVYVGLSDCIF